MAINVTSWSEFVAAVGTSGADVVLPENAVWDMNEISPTFAQDLTISCATVNGRGTEIKNLHITGRIVISGTEIENLSITNILADGAGSGSTGAKAFFVGSNSPKLTNCTFSGSFGTGYDSLFSHTSSSSSNHWYIDRSAFNILANGGTTFATGGLEFYACRLTVTLGAATGQARLGTNTFCEYVLTALGATSIYALGPSSTLRGDLESCTLISGQVKNSPAGVFLKASAPNASPPSDTGYKIFDVTDEQMKNAAYLQSLGFLIGDD